LNGSLIVNPWNTEEMANAINTAITMSEADKEANYLKLLDYVEKYTAAHWVRFSFYLFLSSSLAESQFRETSAEAVN
jgi:trehalose-6-phosphate synthase